MRRRIASDRRCTRRTGSSGRCLILQGLDDRVVPPNQAEAIISALKARGIPHAYVPFEGEDHGFRKAENLRRALETELVFYAEVFGIALADDLPPLGIAQQAPAG